MLNDVKYIGLDVHQATISAAVLNSTGQLLMESIIETKAATILQFVHGLRGHLHATLEEGTWAAWLYDLLRPHVNKLRSRGQGNEANDGAPYPGAQDRGHHSDRLEEGSPFRRRILETASSLSVCGESIPRFDDGRLFLQTIWLEGEYPERRQAARALSTASLDKP